jgi:hypothetical protein
MATPRVYDLGLTGYMVHMGRRQAGGLVIRGPVVTGLFKGLTLIRVVPVGQAGRPAVSLQGSGEAVRVLTGGAGHNAGTKAPT